MKQFNRTDRLLGQLELLLNTIYVLKCQLLELQDYLKCTYVPYAYKRTKSSEEVKLGSIPSSSSVIVNAEIPNFAIVFLIPLATYSWRNSV